MDQQPIPPKSPSSSAPAAAPDAHYQMPPTNPGQTTGIIGLVLPFLGLSLIGLVLSIISTVQSAKANQPKALGIVGIVVNAIGMVVIAFLLLVIVTAASFTNIQERAIDSETKTSAIMVRKHAEAYYQEKGHYPASMREIVLTIETSLPDTRLVEGTATTTKEVSYRPCGSDGAVIQYLQSASVVPVSLYLGAGSVETC